MFFRYLPEQTLQNIVLFYKNLNKLEIIQRLIVSLDLEKIDSFPLINLCLELHFFKALIYICTIYSQDFMTPLIKIFNLYEISQKNNIDHTEIQDYGLRSINIKIKNIIINFLKVFMVFEDVFKARKYFGISNSSRKL